MNKILKLEILLSLALSLFIILSGVIGISTFNYVEVLKIAEIVLIIIGVTLLLINKNNNVKINIFDLLCIGIFLSLLLFVILRGYFSLDLNIEYYFDAPTKRIMYFNYYSYVIMFPLTIIFSYIVTVFMKNINMKK